MGKIVSYGRVQPYDDDRFDAIAEALGVDPAHVVTVAFKFDDKKRLTGVEIDIDPRTAEDFV